ncbi:hypothetical protein N9384_00390 [bacterium]|nr:hypothetical protein [bacterium]
MNFHNYKDHRSAIEKQYGRYYKDYPFAFFLLDYMVQLKVHKQFDGHWVSADLDLFRYTNSVLKRDLLTRVYCCYVRFASFSLRPFRKKFTLHTCFDDEKFPGLNKIIKKVADENDWNISLQPTRDTSLWDLLSLKSISPYRCFISNKTKFLFSKFATSDEDEWHRLLNDGPFMSRLDASVKCDVGFTSKLVKRLGIDIFINTGDSSGNARVLIESAKYVEAKTVSIAHGYFGEEALLGVAPIRSDKLILWTEKQVNDMSKVISPEEVQKLSYVGFLKDFGSTDLVNNQDVALILMGLIRGIVENKRSRLVFLEVIDALKKVSPKVLLRLHPNERQGVPVIDKFVSENKLNVSEGDLRSDIAVASYIVGANTSTLVEAVASGRKVYEIEELAVPGLSYEGTIKIKTNAIYAIDRVFDGSFANGHLRFDEQQVGENLTALFLSLKKSRSN